MKNDQTKNVKEETNPLHEFFELQIRFKVATELLEGLREIFEQCKAWTAEQADFEASELKKFMVLSTHRVIQENQLLIMFELREIQSKILSVERQDAEKRQKEVFHGRLN